MRGIWLGERYMVGLEVYGWVRGIWLGERYMVG